MIVAYKSPNGWHAATSEGLIAYGHPSQAALRAAVSEKVGGDFQLDVVSAEVWRATLQSAIAADTLAAQAFIEAAEQSTVAQRIGAQLALVLRAVEDHTAELAAERERVEAAQAAARARQRAQELQQEQQRRDEEERKAQAERDAIARRELRAAKVGDTVEITEADFVLIGGERRKVRKVVGRFPVNRVPAEYKALL